MKKFTKEELKKRMESFEPQKMETRLQFKKGKCEDGNTGGGPQ